MENGVCAGITAVSLPDFALKLEDIDANNIVLTVLSAKPKKEPKMKAPAAESRTIREGKRRNFIPKNISPDHAHQFIERTPNLTKAKFTLSLHDYALITA